MNVVITGLTIGILCAVALSRVLSSPYQLCYLECIHDGSEPQPHFELVPTIRRTNWTVRRTLAAPLTR